jgi:hypothetical protein
VIYLALALLGFGVADLVRWSPGRVGIRHAGAAATAGAAAVALVAMLSDMSSSGAILVAAIALAALLLWSAYDLLPSDHARPEYALALVLCVIAASIAYSGSADPIGGELATWYSSLGFGFAHHVSVEQFVVGFGGGLFLLGTANRIVRFTLAATKASLVDGESNLRGGRLLGPMERLFVAATVISGDLAGAGLVIAAKGLLRFREIQGVDRGAASGPKIDEVTEYFLVGTFTSVLIAAAIGTLVLATA